jgi:hypothetical protein
VAGRGQDEVNAEGSSDASSSEAQFGANSNSSGDSAALVEATNEAMRRTWWGAEILALPPCDRRRLCACRGRCYQKLEVFGGMGHSVAIAGCEHGP